MNHNQVQQSHIKTAGTIILLALTIWLALFLNCKSFGLYEDDLNRLPKILNTPWQSIWPVFLNLPSQGRPLFDRLILVFSLIPLKTGELYFVYLMGYAIITINAILFYILLKRLSQNEFFSMTGALAFCLFPADTSQILLTHSLGIHPSLTFLLIAFLLYISRKEKSSYIFISCSLLCYEPMYPVFLAAPLLDMRPKSPWGKRLTKHILVMSLIGLCVVLFRLNSHEHRIEGILSSPAMATLAFKNVLIGPFVATSTFLSRPLEVMPYLNKNILILMFCFFCVLTWRLFPAKESSPDQNAPSVSLTRLALTGFLMLVLAYCITGTVEAIKIDGRASRVHAAAILGASILFASACSAVQLAIKTNLRKIILTCIVALWLSFLLAFKLSVQQDYVTSWQYQRAFWTDLVRLCPDITDGTVILVDRRGFKKVKQIHPFSWATPLVLEQIYQLPKTWKITPRVNILREPDIIILQGERLDFSHAVTRLHFIRDAVYTADSTKIIWLENKAGRLTRRIDPLKIGDQDFPLQKNLHTTQRDLPKKRFYDWLIKNPAESSVQYLKGVRP